MKILTRKNARGQLETHAWIGNALLPMKDIPLVELRRQNLLRQLLQDLERLEIARTGSRKAGAARCAGRS